EFLAFDVFPYVQLGPIQNWKRAYVFAGIDATVVKVPDFGPLIFRVPLAETVAEAEEPLLGAGLFLVAPCAANQAIKTKLFDGGEQGGYLKLIATDLTGRRHRDALGDGVIDFADDELRPELPGTTVAELVQFGE